MKLLLTSGGITNGMIAQALFELVGKKPEETSLVVIPTAANGDNGDKSWYIDDLNKLKNLNLKSIDIADISAAEENIWRKKIELADVIYFEGGDEFYLMEWVNRSGLKDWLPKLLETKVFAGASAGSMIAGKILNVRASKIIYGESMDRDEDMPGLNLIDFFFLPHINSQYFTGARKETVKEFAQKHPEKIYALDDKSALKIINNEVKVVSEGECLLFND